MVVDGDARGGGHAGQGLSREGEQVQRARVFEITLEQRSGAVVPDEVYTAFLLRSTEAAEQVLLLVLSAHLEVEVVRERSDVERLEQDRELANVVSAGLAGFGELEAQ